MRTLPSWLPRGSKGRWSVLAIALLAAAGAVAAYNWPRSKAGVRPDAHEGAVLPARLEPQPEAPRGPIHLAVDDQAAIGLKTESATSGQAVDVLRAPGKITPNESHYAFITPRSPGVIRSVAARIGQEVKAGDLLVTIDSPPVGEARLELVTKLQQFEVAKTRATWQSTILKGTLELIERLKAGDSPEQIQKRFEGRPVGENRERLMTAYAQYRLTKIVMERGKNLHADNAVSLADYQTRQAEYEAAQATYQSLMDLMEVETKLADARARQEASQAEIAVQVAREHLRVLGVAPDGMEPKVKEGRIADVRPDGTLPDPSATPKLEAILAEGEKTRVISPVGAPNEESHLLSTYSMWAPFSGTIIDRAAIAPGVAVDTTHQLYTLADLSTVWVEINVHEADFAKLVRGREAKVRLTSAAYPGRVFEAKVIYSGDVVDEKSRSILLLAKAENADRALKPGMFVEAEVVYPSDRTAALVPKSALLTEGERTFVFVKTGPDRFERRDVTTGHEEGGRIAVLKGLDQTDEVVIEGGFKLKTLVARQGQGETTS